MTALLLLVALLAVVLVRMWLRLRALGRRMDGVNVRAEIVFEALREHMDSDHRSQLLVITDRPTVESEEAMKALAAEWGWKV